MARKRKLDSSASTDAEAPKKQQQTKEQPPQQQPQPEQEQDEDEEEYEYEEVEEEVEEEEEEEEEYEEVEEDQDQDQEQDHPDPDDDDDEPIQNLLEPFGKDQLASLLRDAAEKHRDVADRIRRIADADPVHRKIFVHGLGWDTTADTLRAAFVEFGEVEDCKAVCDKVSGKSKGYGFVLFRTRAGARRALAQPQKRIGSRMTACQLASTGPVPVGSAAVQAAQSQGPVSEYTLRKIYVSNVGAEIDTQKLYAFFAKFGEIEEGPLGLDKATGKPKGFCLFVYKTAEGARRALEEQHKNFNGHILHCQKAIDGPKPGKFQQHGHQNQYHHRQNSQRAENSGAKPGAGAGAGHLMAPGGAGIGFNQAAAVAQAAFNPALGQALTALLATQGAGLGLGNLLGTLGSSVAAAAAAPGMQGGYGNHQAGVSPGTVGGGFGNQGGMHGGYSSQQMGQGGTGRGQGGAGQYSGGPAYMGQ